MVFRFTIKKPAEAGFLELRGQYVQYQYRDLTRSPNSGSSILDDFSASLVRIRCVAT